MTTNKAIILAGGKGTRLRPLTLETPKPLITVRRKPILSWICEMFLEHGVNDIKVIIRKDDLEEFEWWLKRFEHNHPKNDYQIGFILEEQPLGTFGLIKTKQVKDWLGNESFFLSNGDELKAINLNEMAVAHEKHVKDNAVATIALIKVENPREYGVAVLEGDKINKFLEKPSEPPSDLVSSGLYILEPSIFEFVTASEYEMIEQLWNNIAEQGRLYGYFHPGKWYDTGTFDRWEKAINEW